MFKETSNNVFETSYTSKRKKPNNHIFEDYLAIAGFLTITEYKVLSGVFCLRDLEAEEKLLTFECYTCKDCNAFCLASESRKQNPPDRTLDLPFFIRYKHLTSLKNLPSPAPSESLPCWFQGNSVAMFVLNYRLRGFLLSTFANRFELRCEPKQLMLLYCKICPC